jgi:hypothetical protein
MSDLRLISFMLFLLVGYPLSGQSGKEDEGYEVVRQDERITMYERWTPFPGTTISSRQIKCVFQTSADLNTLYGYIYQEGKIRLWQDNILEYQIIPKNDTVWIAYSYYRIPWPLNNQDYLLSYSIMEKNENRIVIAFNHAEDNGLHAIRKGVDRRPTIGKWELEKVSKGKIKVTYTITSLPLNHPRFITDRLVHNNLMSTINKLIAIAEK